VERIRDATIRTLIPEWSWKSLSSPSPEPVPETYRGSWRGRLHYGDRVVPITLSVAEKKSTLQIERKKPAPISSLGLIEGMLVGKVRGDLDLPVTRAIKGDRLSLWLKLRASKLEGEISAEAPIPHAEDPERLPFWAEFSRANARSAGQ
jgi:hypothetical protein